MKNHSLNPFSSIFETPGNSKLLSQELVYADVVVCTT